jgi:hypothetical protein
VVVRNKSNAVVHEKNTFGISTLILMRHIPSTDSTVEPKPLIDPPNDLTEPTPPTDPPSHSPEPKLPTDLPNYPIEPKPPTDPPSDPIEPKPPPMMFLPVMPSPIEPKPSPMMFLPVMPSPMMPSPVMPSPVMPSPMMTSRVMPLPVLPLPETPDPPSYGLSSFGPFTARFWVCNTHDRFRDAAAVKAPPSFSPQFPDPDRDITRDFHSHARRAQHRGSLRGA